MVPGGKGGPRGSAFGVVPGNGKEDPEVGVPASIVRVLGESVVDSGIEDRHRELLFYPPALVCTAAQLGAFAAALPKIRGERRKGGDAGEGIIMSTAVPSRGGTSLATEEAAGDDNTEEPEPAKKRPRKTQKRISAAVFKNRVASVPILAAAAEIGIDQANVHGNDELIVRQYLGAWGEEVGSWGSMVIPPTTRNLAGGVVVGQYIGQGIQIVKRVIMPD